LDAARANRKKMELEGQNTTHLLIGYIETLMIGYIGYLCKPFDYGSLCDQRCEEGTIGLSFKPRVLPKLRQCGPPKSCSLKNNTNATRQEGFLLSHFLVSPLWSRGH
jgi:hypothetical protein